MNDLFRIPNAKKKQSSLACIEVCIEFEPCDHQCWVEITFNDVCLARTELAQPCTDICCTFDDSMASINGRLEIRLHTDTNTHCATADIKWLQVQQIDITHMLPHRTVTTENTVSLPMDKPLWTWLIRNWPSVLPKAYALYKSVIRV